MMSRSEAPKCEDVHSVGRRGVTSITLYRARLIAAFLEVLLCRIELLWAFMSFDHMDTDFGMDFYFYEIGTDNLCTDHLRILKNRIFYFLYDSFGSFVSFS
jgi:hypothetical protein